MKKITLDRWVAWAAGSFLIGCFFRLYGIGRQIPLDDEWHGIVSAGTQTFRYLATHLELSGASIPYSLYRRLALVTVGWDEVILRLPSLVAGILALLVCPWFVRRVFKDRAAGLFAFFLAVSPLLIYYSRYSRAYSVTMLLQFICVFSFYFWIATKSQRSKFVFIGSAALGVAFHLFCVITFLACLLYWMFLASSFGRFLLGRPDAGGPVDAPRAGGPTSAKEGLFAFGAAGTLMALFYLPTVLNGSFLEMFLPRLRTLHSSPGIFFNVFLLMSGSANKGVLSLMAVLALMGMRPLYRMDRLLAGLLASVAAVVSGVVFVMASLWIDSGLTVVRYAIVLVPLYLLLVALGLEDLLGLLEKGSRRLFGGRGAAPASVLLLAALSWYFLTGPVLPVYARVNNFPHHNAFQQDYRNVANAQPYRDEYFPVVLAKENISPFYARLAREEGPFSILEYPMLIGHYFNFHYYYQRLHKKDVIAGYLPVMTSSGMKPHPTMVYGNLIFDDYLNDIPCRAKLRFNTIIDILDTQKIKEKARYIILHEDPMQEGFGRRGVLVLSEYPFFDELKRFYRRHFGDPVYADRWITVFFTGGA